MLVFLANKEMAGFLVGFVEGRRAEKGWTGGGGEPKALEAGARGPSVHGVLPGGVIYAWRRCVVGGAGGLGPASRVAVVWLPLVLACVSRQCVVGQLVGTWRPDHGTRAMLNVWAAACGPAAAHKALHRAQTGPVQLV